MKNVYLGEILRLGDLYKVECLRTGHWDYPGIEGGFEITPEKLDAIEANFRLGAKNFELPVDGPSRGGQAHSESDLHDCGWVKDLQRPDPDHLFAVFSVTNPDVQTLIDEGSLKYCSSEIDLAWLDPEDKKTKSVLEGISLTNRPYLKRMEPITPVNLSEMAAAHPEDFPGDRERGRNRNPQEENMATELAEKDAEIKRLQVLLDEAKASGGSTARLAELETKLALSEEEKKATNLRMAELEKSNRETLTRVRMKEITDKLKVHAKRGRLTLPAYQKLVLLSTALVSTGKTVIHLGEKFKLAEGDDDGTDKLDIIDSVLDVLDNLPDSIATDPDDKTAVLDEDGPDSDASDDDKIDKDAKACMREAESKGQKLSYKDAVMQVVAKSRGGGR